MPITLIGIVLVPILSSVGSMRLPSYGAAHGKMNISVEIGVRSGTQIVLFVPPLLLVISFLLTATGVNNEAMAMTFSTMIFLNSGRMS